MKRVGTILVVVSFSALLTLVAACGSGDNGSEDSGVIQVEAKGIRFVPNEIRIPAGEMVTLRLKNEDAMEHDLEVKGLSIRREGIQLPSHDASGGHEGAGAGTLALHTQSKGTASITFTADEKGTYEVWCTIPGHKELGMVAKLIVS